MDQEPGIEPGAGCQGDSASSTSAWYSAESNLKPTVTWIKNLGLSRAQVAKVILAHPQVLGLSIEANLKPTVTWIKSLGLSQAQVANMLAAFPPLLGLCIQTNLKPKQMLILRYFGAQNSKDLLSQNPQLWGYRLSRLQHHLDVSNSRDELPKLPWMSAWVVLQKGFHRRALQICCAGRPQRKKNPCLAESQCRCESSATSRGWLDIGSFLGFCLQDQSI